VFAGDFGVNLGAALLAKCRRLARGETVAKKQTGCERPRIVANAQKLLIDSDEDVTTALPMQAGTCGTSVATPCKESRSQIEAVAIHYRSQEAKN
jgi:hypothetical protein